MTEKVIPFSLNDSPSLIEYVLPAQRLSIDVYKERMGGSGQTLTALGSYWKGRKPLLLNRACILASLLPISKDLKKDLEIFEMLMGMDAVSMHKRLGLKPDQVLPEDSYKALSSRAKRAEDMGESLSSHIWIKVNNHLGTNAFCFEDLVLQLGIMRFGHRPIVADTFSGSGQIPFEAARLGCDVFASDLNPIACLLTWASFNIVGADDLKRAQIEQEQFDLVSKVQEEIDELGVETDGNGWRGKVYLYCLEVICPSSGWKVPVLPTFVISKGKRVIAELQPDAINKRYNILIRSGVSESELKRAEKATYQDQFVVHTVDGIEHRTKISSIRGDYTEDINGIRVKKNKLRQWGLDDVVFEDGDIFNERLYAIQWLRDTGAHRPETEFRAVNASDLIREKIVTEYVKKNLAAWQLAGWVPDMQIESGEKTDEPIRTRGWTYWHHLFNPRQLLILALMFKHGSPNIYALMPRVLNNASRLCRWATAPIRVSKTIPGKQVGGASDNACPVFDNQALNTLYNYGAKASFDLFAALNQATKHAPISKQSKVNIVNEQSASIDYQADIFITDPPYGDAVKYEEILEFFIAWLRKSPPTEFSKWIWDSRRSFAVKGEDHDFKLSMVSAYKKITEKMPQNGLQIIMFTHQSGSIWADMANIVWASGLRVSAAWYIVTETDSALRDGQHVKGTILLVLRKRIDKCESFRDELAYEIKDEVEKQVGMLTGLNNDIKELYRSENLFEDADIQMAGYAAALRVLTKYSVIDGIDMAREAMRPRVKGQTTLVDELIEFAVGIANQYLVPEGLSKKVWDSLDGVERFYLKMLDMEHKGIHTLSNYQNFAKAFKVNDFSLLIGDTKANKTHLKTAEVFGKRGMGASDEFGSTKVRNILYGIFLLIENKISSDDVLHQLKELVPDFYKNRDLLISIADYISKKTSGIRETESQSARILRDLIRNERV